MKNYIDDKHKEEVKLINIDSDKLIYLQFGKEILELASTSIYQDQTCIRANLEFVKTKSFDLN